MSVLPRVCVISSLDSKCVACCLIPMQPTLFRAQYSILTKTRAVFTFWQGPSQLLRRFTCQVLLVATSRPQYAHSWAGMTMLSLTLALASLLRQIKLSYEETLTAKCNVITSLCEIPVHLVQCLSVQSFRNIRCSVDLENMMCI